VNGSTKEDMTSGNEGNEANEDERQQHLQDAAMKSVGVLQGNDPDRAENARSEVRSRLARRHDQL